MTQMLAQREHDYFAETVICANCYIVAKLIHELFKIQTKLFWEHALRFCFDGFGTGLLAMKSQFCAIKFCFCIICFRGCTTGFCLITISFLLCTFFVRLAVRMQYWEKSGQRIAVN